MLRKRKPKYSFITLASDIIITLAAYALAYWVRFSGIFITAQDHPPFYQYAKGALILIPMIVFVFRKYRLYSVRSPLSPIDEMFMIIKATVLVFVTFMAATFVYREFSYSRLVIFIAWIFSVIMLLLSRNIIRHYEARARSSLPERNRLLIVGVNRYARKIISRVQENPRYSYQLAGILSLTPHAEGKHLAGIPIIGTVDQIHDFLDGEKIQEVILADPNLSRDETTEIILKCESKLIGFRLVADFYGLVTSSVDIEHIGDVPLLGLKELPLDDVWNRFLKRCFDVCLSFAGLLICSPLLLAAAILIKIQDRGPVFYTQERLGQDGKVFKILKFRTMPVDAEKQTGPVWAKEKDNRVLPLGKFLRAANIDELPQLWSALQGDMSLVGPRPERPHFVNQFKEMVPRYMARHKIKAGITGWAQVNGFRGNTSLRERIKYDLYYMENWSLFLDIKIIIMTFGAKAFRNAY